jgi:hypothetical protein
MTDYRPMTELDLLTIMIGATTGLIALTVIIVIDGHVQYFRRMPGFPVGELRQTLPSAATIRAIIKRGLSVIVGATFTYFAGFTIFGGWWLCVAIGYAIGVAVTVWRTQRR